MPPKLNLRGHVPPKDLAEYHSDRFTLLGAEAIAQRVAHFKGDSILRRRVRRLFRDLHRANWCTYKRGRKQDPGKKFQDPILP